MKTFSLRAPRTSSPLLQCLLKIAALCSTVCNFKTSPHLFQRSPSALLSWSARLCSAAWTFSSLKLRGKKRKTVQKSNKIRWCSIFEKKKCCHEPWFQAAATPRTQPSRQQRKKQNSKQGSTSFRIWISSWKEHLGSKRLCQVQPQHGLFP